MRTPADAPVQVTEHVTEHVTDHVTQHVTQHVTELPVDPVSAGRARRFVSAALDGWALTDLTEEAVLLTSEVVTNALLHTTSDLIRLRLSLLNDGIRVEVEDASTLLPRTRGGSSSSTTGRGLALVESAARSWGAEPADHGKTVWFEIAAVPEA